MHAKPGQQRRICALVFVDATCRGESRHRNPSLEVRVDIFRPARFTATRPVMRNMQITCGFPGSDLIDAFSSFFLLQGSFLPVIGRALVSVEYRILCIHDFPSPGYDERQVSRRAERSL